jgi:hypothetical protein
LYKIEDKVYGTLRRNLTGKHPLGRPRITYRYKIQIVIIIEDLRVSEN